MKTPPTLEKVVERKVCVDAKKKLDIHNIKCNGRGQVGWPDRMFLVKGGRPVFIEFKQKGKKLTLLQAHMAVILTQKNYPVHRCDNYQEAMNLLSHYHEMTTP